MDDNTKVIDISAAFIIKNNKVLLLEKSEGGKFEFPYARLQKGEKYDQALERVLKDDFSLSPEIVKEVGSVEVDHEGEVLLEMYILVKADIDEIELKNHKGYKLASFDELKAMELSEATKMFLDEYEKEIKGYIN